MPLNRENVIEAYHQLLGRFPENEDVIKLHLARHTEIDSLFESIASTPEHFLHRMGPPTGILSLDLDNFIKISDAFDGPDGSAAKLFFSQIDFDAQSLDAQLLDPLSDEYYQGQLGLYERISARKLDQISFEQTDVADLDFHVKGHNPYNNIPPDLAAFHLLRLAKLFRFARVPFNGHVLDMGAGWGMSSEIAAYVGCRVTALDINPQFVELITRRAAASRLPITAVHSTFDEFPSREDEKFDMIMFYECLHHATKPWELISRLARFVRTGGCIALAGEPINEYWWRSWGLRLDPLSVYCIRKFGWFESGWTQAFICECLRRAGLVPDVIEDADLGIGKIIIARKT